MGGKRKRKNVTEHRRIHPRNKYSDNTPDFGLLSSLYPSFQPYVFYLGDGRPKIDWTDFNATRELTRVLLLHDHGINWWIPDGQLCPTVPNRLNYIHWIEDLLSLNIIPETRAADEVRKGFDIGTGANCIYPLLGASTFGWKFVGSDITDVAIEWADQNVQSNPHIAELIEIRKVASEDKMFVEELQNTSHNSSETGSDSDIEPHDNGLVSSSVLETHSGVTKSYDGPPVLVGTVKDGEKFDFCMCNPPFFETMEEAGLNPRTSCGGTHEEMVCSGGEHAFISRIIEDSVQLKHTFRWYTSMVGRKLNLNSLVSELWNAGATVVKTTEFVQGRTSRWGLAWSFLPPSTKLISSRVIEENNLSFMLEGLQRQHSAFHVLQSVEVYLAGTGASCKLDATSFNVDITASKHQIDTILKTEAQNKVEDSSWHHELNISNASDALCFRISVFQQIPGTLLVRGILLEKESSIPVTGSFPLVFRKLEAVLNNKFSSGRVLADWSSSRHVK